MFNKRLFWVALSVALLATFLVVGAVSAAGGLWTRVKAPFYELPDVSLPTLDDQGVPVTLDADLPVIVSASQPGFAQLAASKAYTDTAVGKWVKMSDLTSVKPAKVAEKELEADFEKLELGKMSFGRFLALLKKYWAITAPTTQTAPTSTPITTTVATPAAPAVSTTNWPQTAAEFLALATAGQPTPPTDGSWRPIELAEVHRALGEPNSWAVTREKNEKGEIIPFWINNFSNRAQDGYCLISGKYTTGTPVGFQGLSQGVTFRP